jgi:hypothetical protein
MEGTQDWEPDTERLRKVPLEPTHKEDPARIILTKLLTMSITSFAEELINNARAIAAPGKGILAADESTGKYKSTTFIVTGFLCLN